MNNERLRVVSTILLITSTALECTAQKFGSSSIQRWYQPWLFAPRALQTSDAYLGDVETPGKGVYPSVWPRVMSTLLKKPSDVWPGMNLQFGAKGASGSVRDSKGRFQMSREEKMEGKEVLTFLQALDDQALALGK
jgi:hypothetical protein